ncbi:MAG: heme-binding domain-containing protein [Flavobacteriales bacterium]
MKSKKIFPLLIVTVSLVLFSFSSKKTNYYSTISTTEIIEIPENIQTILDNKCMGCHSNESKGGKSKMKMNFDKLTNGDYTTGKIISKLEKINKVLTNEKMPPKKLLERFPDKKLTPDESQLILDWANKQKEALMNE